MKEASKATTHLITDEFYLRWTPSLKGPEQQHIKFFLWALVVGLLASCDLVCRPLFDRWLGACGSTSRHAHIGVLA